MVGIGEDDDGDVRALSLDLAQDVLRARIGRLMVAAAQEPELARLDLLNHRPRLVFEAQALRGGRAGGLDVGGRKFQEQAGI